MRRALSFAFFLACSFAFAAGSEESSAQAQQAPMRRFALVMGANSGGEGSVRLRYAVSDARAFASLLTELGGVKGEDLVLLSDPSLSAFRGAAERMRAATVAANASGQRCELMLYYSGHSDEEGLLLGRERLGYSDLRAAIERVPAAVRVAILDSCSSGSLTRAKGGASRPAFLFDASAEMEGHAYITSSSEAEAAQESDRIGGSFFTHYLVSALRGAADIHGEGKVTLNEAYAYAFRETLASTENTQYGPQHPAYEISLTGSGDLVFTDLRSSRAGLALAEALSGSIYVRDAKGNLAVELDKAAGDSMEIGLPPGKYAVSMIDGASRSQADIVVPAGGRTFLAPADFRPAVPEKAAARGSAANAGAVDTLATSVAGFPIVFSARPFPDLSQGGFSSDEDKPISFNALWGQARDVKVQVSSLVNADSGDLQGFQYASLMNAVKGRASGVQFAPIANVAYGGFGGTQIFSLVNYSGGGGEGSGLQLGEIGNFATGKVGGVQLGGIANVALGGFSGVQLSGLVNYSKGQGLGAQVGLINIASSVSGAQVGLVNISDRIDGVPLGLVNIEKGGVLSPQLWTEGVSSMHVGYAFGTRLFYTLASAGFGLGSGSESPSTGLGMGARLAIGPFIGDLDLSWRELYGDGSTLDFSRPQSRLALRALAGFPAKGTGLIAGCALEGFMPGLSRDDDGSSVSSFRVDPTFLVGMKF